MKRTYIFLFVGVAALVAILLLYLPRKNPVRFSPQKDMEIEKQSGTFVTVKEKSKKESNTAAEPAEAQPPPINDPASGSDTSEFAVTDQHGKDSIQRKTSLEEAQATLQKSQGINPEIEFEGLTEADFSNPQTGMLSGWFLDPDKDVEIDINIDESGSRFAGGCIYSKESGVLRSYQQEFIFRTDNKGFGMIRAANKWLIRIAWAMPPSNRFLVGSIHKFDGNGWSLVNEFQAGEVRKLKHCFLPAL